MNVDPRSLLLFLLKAVSEDCRGKLEEEESFSPGYTEDHLMDDPKVTVNHKSERP